MLLGLFTIRVVPHAETAVPEQHSPRDALEVGLLEEGERRRSESWDAHTTVTAGGVYAQLSDSETEEEESRAASGTGTPIDGGGQTEQRPLKLSPSRTRNSQPLSQHSHQTTTSNGRSRSRIRTSHHQHEHVDIHGWGLLRSRDFWILVGIMACRKFIWGQLER